ncbi:MAG: TonB-dependent receptor [Steroidobacteraceae bacterium]
MTLQEVVVTAQKREEKLQDVPISITAVSSEQLEQRGVDSLAGLNSIAPNVMVRQSPGSKLISVVSIRGSVAGQPAIWFDPPVGLYLNGVYLGKSQGSVFDVVDIERVEVLRGPQGTLFGRNTEGGAINFITRQPSGEFRGKFGIEVGNFDRRVTKLNLDLPRFGIASASLGARKEERDGWAKNLTGPDMGAIDSEAARASLKLDFSDRFAATYDFDYSRSRNTPSPTTLLATNGWGGTFPSMLGPAFAPVFGPAAALQLTTAIENAIVPYLTSSRPDTVSTNGGPIAEAGKTNAHSLTLDWQVGDRDQLKYIGARRLMRYGDRQDIDGTPLAAIPTGLAAPFPAFWGMSAYYQRTTEYEQDSHELQWVGDRDRFNYVVGLYYFKDDGQTTGAQSFTLFGQPPQSQSYATSTRSKAVFAQGDYRITDRWTATLGLRYTEEEKAGWSHRYRTNGLNGPPLADILPFTAYSADFSGTTPMASISFKPSGNLNFYARVAKGFKSGGFSAELSTPDVSTPFQPQTSVSTEVGVKSTLLDGRARLNVALYNTDISDQQLTQLLPGTTQSRVTNAGESTYRGVEVEAALLVADGWQVQLSYGYLDAKYDKYLDNPIICQTIPGFGQLCRADSTRIIDTASNRLPPNAPEHTLNLNLDGRLARGAWGELRALLDYSYTAKTYLYAVNESHTAPNIGGQYWADMDGIPAEKNLNARLLLAGVPAGPGTLDVSLWGRNLTDDDALLAGIDFGMFRTANWREPRTYMVTATYNW